MIEVRIDIDHMQSHQHNVMHSILMMHMLREAGIPVIGKIIFNGPERGTLTSWREQDLDSDLWVVRWHDEHECTDRNDPSLVLLNSGFGKGFTYSCYGKSSDEAYKQKRNTKLPTTLILTNTPGASDWDREDDDL